MHKVYSVGQSKGSIVLSMAMIVNPGVRSEGGLVRGVGRISQWGTDVGMTSGEAGRTSRGLGAGPASGRGLPREGSVAGPGLGLLPVSLCLVARMKIRASGFRRLRRRQGLGFMVAPRQFMVWSVVLAWPNWGLGADERPADLVELSRAGVLEILGLTIDGSMTRGLGEEGPAGAGLHLKGPVSATLHVMLGAAAMLGVVPNQVEVFAAEAAMMTLGGSSLDVTIFRLAPGGAVVGSAGDVRTAIPGACRGPGCIFLGEIHRMLEGLARSAASVDMLGSQDESTGLRI